MQSAFVRSKRFCKVHRKLLVMKTFFGSPYSERRSYEFNAILRPSVCNTIYARLVLYFILIFSVKVGSNKKIKSDGVCFLKKILLCIKWSKWDILGPKINIFKLFSKSCSLSFFDLYLMIGTKNWRKVTVLKFRGKLLS